MYRRGVIMKRGSLSLSTNAIVVMILAIAILGLALGFANGMFKTLEDKLKENMGNEPTPETATSSNPLTLSRPTITARDFNDIPLKIGFFCDGETCSIAADAATIECSGGATMSASHLGDSTTLGESLVIESLLDVTNNPAKGKYNCRLTLSDKKADFYLEIS